MKKIILIMLFFFFSLTVPALHFRNGVHLINYDNRAYKIIYNDDSDLSTSICWINKPDRKIKNGIAPAVMRSIKGFKILSRHKKTITALVNSKARIYCLCTKSCSVEIVGIQKIDNIENKKIIIKNKVVFIK